MIDLTREPLIRLTEAARIVGPGRGDRPHHLTTLLRWVTDGVRGPGGGRVHLEAVRVGGAWKTSKEALRRFTERLTPRIGEQAPGSPAPSPGPRVSSPHELESVAI